MNDFHSSVFSRKRGFSAITTSPLSATIDGEAAPMPKRAASFPFARSLSADAMRFLEENAMPDDAPPHPVLQRQQAVVWCPHDSNHISDEEVGAQPLLLRPMGATTLLRNTVSFRATSSYSNGCATRAVLSKLRF